MAAFENLPNFRQAGGVGLTNRHGKRVKDGLLYRSSRTDFITSKDKTLFLQLGIKSIVDLRRQSEFERADGEKLLQSLYPVWIVKEGTVKQMKPSRRWGKKRGSQQTQDDPNTIGRRYLVNMWTMDLIWSIFKQLNFIIRWMSLVLALIDWFIGTHMFVKFYAKLVVNHQSVTEQYLNVLDYTKSPIVDVLRLMLQDDNLPMLIHCAHGKDRTGLITAILLGLLEVNEEDIATDYAESEAGLASIKDRVYKEIVLRYGFNQECTRADKSTMEEVLYNINEKYGSISLYLLSAGFTIEEQENLKNIFLD